MSRHKFRGAAAGVPAALLLLLSATGAAEAEGDSGPEAMRIGDMCMVIFGY
jgi:hypothetical protein